MCWRVQSKEGDFLAMSMGARFRGGMAVIRVVCLLLRGRRTGKGRGKVAVYGDSGGRWGRIITDSV
jgi:hypothetical protein